MVRVGPSVLRLGTDLLRGERRGLHKLAEWKHLLARQHGPIQLHQGADGSMASGKGTRGRSATQEVESLQVEGHSHHGGTWGKQKVGVPALHPLATHEPMDTSGLVGPRAGPPTPGGMLHLGITAWWEVKRCLPFWWCPQGIKPAQEPCRVPKCAVTPS